jgi:hypothetical protein
LQNLPYTTRWADIRSSATLTVTGQPRSIAGEERAFLSVATVAS